VIDDNIVDGLVYLHTDDTEHRMPRDESGRLVGTSFEGRSSIRELARGSKTLDQLVES
jgi:hypothetical protein